MRTTQRQLTRRVLVVVAGACLLTAACGSDKKAATAKPATATASAASESAYCDTARAWSLHEIVPVDDQNPAVFKPYWQEYLAFNAKARGLAPTQLRDEWALSVGAIDSIITPVLEKFQYDVGRLMAEGTDAEKAVTDPPANVQAAQAKIHLYESNVCASEQPPAAQVDFSGEKKAAAYCDAVTANNELVAKVFGDGAKPAAVRQLMEGKELQAAVTKEYDTAPPALKADRQILHDYWVKQQVPLWAKYGYDIRKALLDGPQADREILQSTAPAVRDHYARAAAYEAQVCGQ